MPDDTVNGGELGAVIARVTAIETDLSSIKSDVSDLLSRFSTEYDKIGKLVELRISTAVESLIGSAKDAPSVAGVPFDLGDRLTTIEAAVEHVVGNIRTALGSQFTYVAPANLPAATAIDTVRVPTHDVYGNLLPSVAGVAGIDPAFPNVKLGG